MVITNSTYFAVPGSPIPTTGPLGRKTTFEYDAAGNVTKITDPALHVTRFTYDAVFNRVTTITDALNQITEFTYDPANGNLLTVKDPLNHVTTIAYNAFGQPTSVQGPIPTEPPTTFAYDADGNLITTTDALENSTQRIYDAVSRLVSLTDPRGTQTQFQYDALNRVTAIADARHGLTAFSYDANGNLLTVSDAKNQATTYTYDPMDRLKTRKDALNRTETYNYDGAGNLTQFTDRKNQQSTFTYDSLNRRTNSSFADGSSTTFTYDSVGRLTRTTDSLSGAIEFGYDALDRLVLELTGLGALVYQYDAISRRTTMTVSGQAPVSYQYDAASRLTQVGQGTLTVGLGYDNADRRTSLTYPNGTNTTYTYDNASRLTRILHQGPSAVIDDLTYTYDAAGNRSSLNRVNGTASLLPTAVASAAYDAANEQAQFGGATLTYDQNGNLTNDGTNTYTWDTRNRLIGITGPSLAASFSYDAVGRRVSKTINGVRTDFLYDGKDIVAELGGGAVGATYVRNPNIIDEAFVRQLAGGKEYYHTDAAESAFILTNDAQAVQTTYTYEPYGHTTSSGVSSNAFQYTGRENDQTGLYYYRARYYATLRGRFTAEDPLYRYLPGDNLYVYSRNNPIAEKDPSGESPLVVGAGLVGGGYGAVTEGVKAYMDGKGGVAVAGAAARGFVAGFAAGFVGAAAVVFTKHPAALGAISGGIYDFFNQKLDPERKEFSFCELAKDVGFGAVLGPLANRIIPKVPGREPNPFKSRDLLNEPKSVRALKVGSLGGLAGFYEELATQGLGLGCP